MTTINAGRDLEAFESERNSFLQKKQANNQDFGEKRIGNS